MSIHWAIPKENTNHTYYIIGQWRLNYLQNINAYADSHT